VMTGIFLFAFCRFDSRKKTFRDQNNDGCSFRDPVWNYLFARPTNAEVVDDACVSLLIPMLFYLFTYYSW